MRPIVRTVLYSYGGRKMKGRRAEPWSRLFNGAVANVQHSSTRLAYSACLDPSAEPRIKTLVQSCRFQDLCSWALPRLLPSIPLETVAGLRARIFSKQLCTIVSILILSRRCDNSLLIVAVCHDVPDVRKFTTLPRGPSSPPLS